MSPLEIEVGRTYTNRGAGKTHRTVIAIGNEHRPDRFWSKNEPPNEPGVLYEQNGNRRNLYLSSFAQWCGNDVTPNAEVRGATPTGGASISTDVLGVGRKGERT